MINIMQRTRSGGFGQFLFRLILLIVIGGALWMMMTQAHARRHDKYV